MDLLVHGMSSIAIYLLICIVFIGFAHNSYRRSIRIGKPQKKLSFFVIIVTSFFFALLNRFNTLPGMYGSDRINYLQDFNGRLTAYSSFDWYLQSLKKVTGGSFDLTLYITTFICCCVLLCVYKYCKYTSPYTLMFILSTNFVFFTFTGLKQSIAAVFANVFFLIILSDKRNVITDIVCWIAILFACSFHVTGYILVPLYFILRLNYRNNKRSLRILILFLISILFMRQILLGLAYVSGSILPLLSNKITEYLAEDTQQTTEGTLAVLKGVPYYALALYAFKRRNKYVNRIPKFDQLFILSVVVALLAFSTIISYWFSRFTVLFVFPAGVLFGQMIKESDNKVDKHNLEILVLIPMLFFTLRSVLLVYVNYGGY